MYTYTFSFFTFEDCSMYLILILVVEIMKTFLEAFANHTVNYYFIFSGSGVVVLTEKSKLRTWNKRFNTFLNWQSLFLWLFLSSLDNFCSSL